MFCPNCGASDVSADAAACHACKADFTVAGGWRPVASPGAADAGGQLGGTVVSAVNYLLGTAAIVILGLAVVLPSAIGGKPGRAADERLWGMAAMAALLVGLFVVVKRVGYSILVLLFACGFFFASCAANFHWKGG